MIPSRVVVRELDCDGEGPTRCRQQQLCWTARTVCECAVVVDAENVDQRNRRTSSMKSFQLTGGEPNKGTTSITNDERGPQSPVRVVSARRTCSIEDSSPG